METKDTQNAIAFKAYKKIILPGILLGLLVIIYLMRSYAVVRNQEIKGWFFIYMPILMLLVILRIAYLLALPNILVKHDGKCIVIKNVIYKKLISLRDIDMVYERKFGFRAFPTSYGKLLIVTRTQGIIKVNNVKDVDSAKISLVLLVKNYKLIMGKDE